MNKIQMGNSTLANMMCVLVILTNLSQMPIFVDDGITQYVSMPLWVILFVYCIIKRKHPAIPAFKTVACLSVFFGIFYMIASAINPSYTQTGLPSVLMISLFVLVCSSCIANDLDYRVLDKMMTCYVLSVIAVGISVYVLYIANGSLTDRVYLYSEKNSFSQILLTGWVIILFTKFEGNLKKRLFYMAVMIFFTYMIIMLQSRATIIGIPLVLAVALFNGRNSKSAKTVAVLFIVVAFVLLFNKETLDYFIDYVLYAGRDSENIHALSSGRSDEWAEFFEYFDQSPIFGLGKCKRESIILTALLEFGVVGGIPLLIIACTPLAFVVTARKKIKIDAHFLIFAALAITYTINGIFEQLAPYGPGVKCYFLWFLYGFYATQIWTLKQRKRKKWVEEDCH